MGNSAFDSLPPELREKVLAARASQGGNRLKRGSYLVVLDDFLLRGLRKGTFFTADAHVIECESTDPSVTPNAVNSAVGVLHCNLTTNDAAASNMRQAVEATFDLDGTIESYTKKLGEAAWDGKDKAHSRPARGMLVAVSTYATQKDPDAAYPKFQHVPGQTAEGIAARRKALDEGRVPTGDELKDVAGE